MPNNPTTIRLRKKDKKAIEKLLKRYTFLTGTTAVIRFALSHAADAPKTARVPEDATKETT